MDLPSIIQLALPVPLRRRFDYRHNPALGPLPEPGCRVEAPFGKRTLIGVVMGINTTSDLADDAIKPIIRIIDTQPLLPPDLLHFIEWAADYYQHPLGDALQAALPVLLRQGRAPEVVANPQHQAIGLTREGLGLPAGALKRAPRQAALVAALQQTDALTLTDCKAQGFTTDIIRELKRKGLVENTVKDISSLQAAALLEPPLSLNAEQDQAVQTIAPGSFQPYLLDGATGSGKTEVYLQTIARVLAANTQQQALVLVPEIGLTPQMLSRFTRRFGATVACLHSGMNDTERLDAWCRAASGEAQIIIGTRSAIFIPLPRAGIIIVDEEHDNSYKQQDGFRYSARDLAILRGRNLGIPVILGSATPSLETLNNTDQGRYIHLPLTRSALAAKPASMSLINTQNSQMQQGLSDVSIATIGRHIANGNQVLVFLNRRGYAPTLQCTDCGWIAECPHCDARFTLHRTPSHLHCHHCDRQQAVPRRCEACHGSRLTALGAGTERSEQQLQTLFKDTPIIRIDRDSTRGKNTLPTLLKRVQTGEPCILIGTQMLAKGHHFPDVTLAVILDTDSGLFSTDFRGAERMGQLLIQVAGRAGRAEKPGEVILQSRYPDHPLITTLVEQGYHTFARLLLDERQLTLMPPFSYLALVRADAPNPAQALDFLQHAKSLASHINTANAVEILGPLPALMERRGQRYRFYLQLKASSRARLNTLIQQLVQQLDSRRQPAGLRWSIDIDPQDMS